MPQFRTAALLFLLGASAAAGPGDNDTVWVEGENASIKHVTPHVWYSDAVRKEQMSGGAWLSHFSGSEDGTAQYDLTIPKDGNYVLWVRCNPAGALSYQVSGGSWTKLDNSKALDVVNLAADDKADLRYLGWLRAGPLPLKQGPLSLSFKMHSPGQHHGSIDCFTLTTRPFEPRGILKPGEVQAPPFVPTLSDDTIRKWVDYIRPSDADNKWERLEWRTELGAAIQEAQALQRPILLWAMNGHPLGCT
jgi:hypothetical protein